MARREINTVLLERQPHRDGLKRMQLAYQRLIAATTINMEQVQQVQEKQQVSQLPKEKK